MKKILFILFIVCTSSLTINAQKYACVNIDYVMAHVPDYSQAQSRLNKYIEEWRTELDNKSNELDKLKQAYEKEAYLLPDGLKRRRQEEIKNKEQEVISLQRQRFSTGGDLDKKRAELMKPVQDRVYSAIERIANEKSYIFVFDKSASSTIIFANKKYDISDQVLEILGYSPSQDADNSNNTQSTKALSNPELNRNQKERNYQR